MVIRDLLVAIGFNLDKNSLVAAEAKIGNLKKGLGSIETAGSKAGRNSGRAIADIGNSADRATTKLDGLVNGFYKLAAFTGITFSLGSVVGIVDEWKAINDQITIVSANQEESLIAQKEIYRIAQATRQQYQATASLYASVATSAKELGKSQAEVLAFTEDVNRAMILGGGSAAGQQAALVQLGQALASGTLRGDELNSILEQSRRLARAIADGMGVSIGQLRTLGAEGKLTANDVFMAIRSQSEVLRSEMGKTQWRVEQAYTRMMNSAGRFFSGVEKRTGAVSMVARVIASVADFIEGINIDNFIAGFRLLLIYVSAFLAVSKFAVMIQMFQTLKAVIIGVRNAYLAATGAAVAYKWAGLQAAGVSMLAFAKFALIAAAITAVILDVQDFYTWVKGGKSVIGSAIGEWNGFVDGVKAKWDEVTQSVADFLDMRIIDMIKAAIGWIGELQDKIASLNIRERVNKWWEANVSAPVNETISGVANGATAHGPALSSQQQEAYGHMIGGLMGDNAKTGNVAVNRYAASNIVNTASKRSYADNSQHTNYVNVNVKTNASPERIGNAVADSISNIGYDAGFGFDSPATEAI